MHTKNNVKWIKLTCDDFVPKNLKTMANTGKVWQAVRNCKFL